MRSTQLKKVRSQIHLRCERPLTPKVDNSSVGGVCGEYPRSRAKTTDEIYIGIHYVRVCRNARTGDASPMRQLGRLTAHYITLRCCSDGLTSLCNAIRCSGLYILALSRRISNFPPQGSVQRLPGVTCCCSCSSRACTLMS